MSLKPEYINAIERKLGWLRWSKSAEGQRTFALGDAAAALPVYQRMLEFGDTYYMVPPFAALVDAARREIPDTITFDPKWLLSDRGFLWLDAPFAVPPIHANMRARTPPGLEPLLSGVRAIGWEKVPAGARTYLFPSARIEAGAAPAGAIQFACFEDFGDEAEGVRRWSLDGSPVDPHGFGFWSYFMLQEGDALGTKIREFETVANQAQAPGSYELANRTTEVLHEIRWVYTALHLMAQRLTQTITEPIDRATRRRAERHQQTAPATIQVITLRRMVLERQRAQVPHDVDWQWQWSVKGHWRKQFYPSEHRHKDVFIESYVKGPPEKPMKPGAIKLFVGKR